MKQLQTIGASVSPKPVKSGSKNPFSFVDPFEALDMLEKPLGSVKNIGKTLAEPLGESAKIVGGDILSQFGFERKSDSAMSGDIPEGEGVDIKALVAKRKEEEEKAKEEAKKKNSIETDINYFRDIKHSGEQGVQKENQELQRTVQELIVELQRMASSSQEISAQVSVAVGPSIAKVGKYHVNFFKWMLMVVRDARMKVENSGAWLSMMKGKQKKGLMGVAKQKGSNMQLKTNVLMSGERTVQTQTG